MVDNIRPFKPRTADTSYLDKILAAALYIGLGWLLRTSGAGEDGFNLFLLLGIFYWVFVQRKVIKTSYFFRYHYLQATLLFLFLFFALLILSVATGAIAALFELLGLSAVISGSGSELRQILALVVYYGYPILGVAQALPALLGKTPRLPLITANVMYYV